MLRDRVDRVGGGDATKRIVAPASVTHEVQQALMGSISLPIQLQRGTFAQARKHAMLVVHPDIEPKLELVDPATRSLLYAADALAFAIARHRTEHGVADRRAR